MINTKISAGIRLQKRIRRSYLRCMKYITPSPASSDRQREQRGQQDVPAGRPA